MKQKRRKYESRFEKPFMSRPLIGRGWWNAGILPGGERSRTGFGCCGCRSVCVVSECDDCEQRQQRHGDARTGGDIDRVRVLLRRDAVIRAGCKRWSDARERLSESRAVQTADHVDVSARNLRGAKQCI